MLVAGIAGGLALAGEKEPFGVNTTLFHDAAAVLLREFLLARLVDTSAVTGP